MKYVVRVVLAARIPSPLPGCVLQLKGQQNQGQQARAGRARLVILAIPRAETGGLKVQGQPGQLKETLSQNS